MKKFSPAPPQPPPKKFFYDPPPSEFFYDPPLAPKSLLTYAFAGQQLIGRVVIVTLIVTTD